MHDFGKLNTKRHPTSARFWCFFYKSADEDVSDGGAKFGTKSIPDPDMVQYQFFRDQLKITYRVCPMCQMVTFNPLSTRSHPTSARFQNSWHASVRLTARGTYPDPGGTKFGDPVQKHFNFIFQSWNVRFWKIKYKETPHVCQILVFFYKSADEDVSDGGSQVWH